MVQPSVAARIACRVAEAVPALPAPSADGFTVWRCADCNARLAELRLAAGSTVRLKCLRCQTRNVVVAQDAAGVVA